MQRSATLAGPGIARVPASHRPTVASSTSKAAAVSRRFMPSAAMASRSSSADIACPTRHVDASISARAAGAKNFPSLISQVGIGRHERSERHALRLGYEARLAVGLGDNQVIGGALAHAFCVVPMALHVKEISHAR